MNTTIGNHADINTHSPRSMPFGLHERSNSNHTNSHRVMSDCHGKQQNVPHAKQTVASLLHSFNNTLSECKKSVHRFEALIQSMNDLHTQVQNE